MNIFRIQSLRCELIRWPADTLAGGVGKTNIESIFGSKLYT